MDTQIDLDQLHQAIIDSIKARFPELQTVEDYEAPRKQLSVPACLIELTEMEPDDRDTGTEQLHITLIFEAHLIIGFKTEQAKRAVRKLAAALAHHINKNRWGQKIDPARVTTVFDNAFSPEQDKYETWTVEWRQNGLIGENIWTNEGELPSQVFIAWAPEVGVEHEDGYTPLESVE